MVLLYIYNASKQTKFLLICDRAETNVVFIDEWDSDLDDFDLPPVTDQQTLRGREREKTIE